MHGTCARKPVQALDTLGQCVKTRDPPGQATNTQPQQWRGNEPHSAEDSPNHKTWRGCKRVQLNAA